ncbi:MAG: phage holin family protein [Caldilineaceae bacterium]
METIFTMLAYFIASAVVIWIVGKLNLGLTVTGFGGALIAAVVIALVTGLVAWLFTILGISVGGGFIGGLIALVIAAVVLLLSDKFAPGMKVNGFVGAIVAALGIGLVGWLIEWLFGLFGLV